MTLAEPGTLQFEAARWYLQQRLNIDITGGAKPSFEEGVLYGAGQLAVAGADGLAEEELDWLEGFWAIVGQTKEQQDKLEEFKKLSLEEILRKFEENDVLKAARGNFLYTCIEAAGADGTVTEKELDAVKAVAVTLDSTHEYVDSLNALYQEERLWREKHLELLWGGSAPAAPLSGVSAADASTQEFNRYRWTRFYCAHRLGCDIKKAPVPSAEARETYAAALLACASADGLAAPELDWIRGFLACVGAPKDLIEKLDGLGGRAEEDLCATFRDLPELMTAKRSFLYDCVSACGADGDLNEKELAAIKRFATALSVEDPDECVNQLCDDYHAEMKWKGKYLPVIWERGGGPESTFAWKDL